MSKYARLGEYLRRQTAEQVPMAFRDIERIIGVKLPPSAAKHRPWWSNNARNSVLTKVWIDAGFKSEQVDMAAGKLVFRRVRPALALPAEGEPRHHPAFGALKGLVRIMPGTDLTQPADHSWSRIADEAK